MLQTVLKYRVSIILVIILSFSAWLLRKPHADAAPLPYYDSPDFTPRWIKNKKDAAQSIQHRIADFSCTNQDGKTITQKDVAGEIYVADFFFTSCASICPKMTHQMHTVQQAFRNDKDVKLLSFSVTPWLDSVPRLRNYAARNDVQNGQWQLLTGQRSKIYELARKSFFAEEETGFSKDSTEFLHTEHFVLVDKTGRIRGLYSGTLPLDAERLIADINVLKKE